MDSFLKVLKAYIFLIKHVSADTLTTTDRVLHSVIHSPAVPGDDRLTTSDQVLHSVIHSPPVLSADTLTTTDRILHQ
jgi:hypothetical protein